MPEDAHSLTGPDAASLLPIVDGVWAWVQPDGAWWVNNAGAVGGSDGVLIIDTCATDRRTRRFLAAVADVTDAAPIRWAANTHQHGDHCYGNSELPAETVLIGHAAMRAGLSIDPIIDGCPPFWSPRPDWGEVSRRLPSITFETSAQVHTGSSTAQLLHPGYAAHTTGDIVAWLPDERVLFAGDLLFHGLTPLIFMGSLDGALRALDWLAGFEADHIVPGHGPLIAAGALPAVLADHERYYRMVAAIGRAGRAAGLNPLEAAKETELGEFAGWPDAERLVLNLHRDYADDSGISLDLIAAFSDAVAWHGGPLPTSV